MKETAKDPLYRYIQFFLTGFAIFDIIHLVCAITLLIIAGLCAMIALVPIQFAMEFYTKEQAVILTFHLIKSVAPLAFAPLGISLVAHKESRTVFFCDLN